MVSSEPLVDPLATLPVPKPLPKGLDAWADRLQGRLKRRAALRHELLALAGRVMAREKAWADRRDAELQAELQRFREGFRRGRLPPDAVLEAFAAVREAARRAVGLHPFMVQVAGGLALHRGTLAEMATGEGKSLTAAIAAVLGGWSGRPCHVVTVNDYLAARDAQRFAPLFALCGVSVGWVTGGMPPPERKAGHAAAVTYTTGKELAADFLRDRLALGPRASAPRRVVEALLQTGAAAGSGTVLRGLHTALVDEADSVLVDEAVTPLIIAGHAVAPAEEQELYRWGAAVAENLTEGTHYTLDRRRGDLQLTAAAHAVLRRRQPEAPAGASDGRLTELIEQAVVAREYFERGRQYVLSEDRVTIVDEFTGRLMPHRKWRAGLHQAIEAREGVPVTPVDDTLARISFQNFFRLFRRLSGMSGTLREVAAEAWQTYRLPLVTIPTHRPCIRRQDADRVFATLAAKWEAVAAEIARLHAAGRPILVGTRTIADSERLAALLAQRRLEANVLNGVQDKTEAQIVAEAGRDAQITIATNMAGRGTDIELGPGVAARGGLHVIATERHASQRVDRQLYGRAGRQGDPGSAQAFVSFEDELLRRHLPPMLRRTLQALGPRSPGARAAFALAQSRAQAMALRQRVAVMRQDDWLEDALSFARG